MKNAGERDTFLRVAAQSNGRWLKPGVDVATKDEGAPWKPTISALAARQTRFGVEGA